MNPPVPQVDVAALGKQSRKLCYLIGVLAEDCDSLHRGRLELRLEESFGLAQRLATSLGERDNQPP